MGTQTCLSLCPWYLRVACALSRTCPFGEPQRPARGGGGCSPVGEIFLRYMGLSDYGSLRLRRSHLPGGAVALSPAKTRDYGTRLSARAARNQPLVRHHRQRNVPPFAWPDICALAGRPSSGGFH